MCRHDIHSAGWWALQQQLGTLTVSMIRMHVCLPNEYVDTSEQCDRTTSHANIQHIYVDFLKSHTTSMVLYLCC